MTIISVEVGLAYGIEAMYVVVCFHKTAGKHFMFSVCKYN